MTGDLNPWRRLRALAEWTLRWHEPDADRRMGVTRHAHRTISLRSDLTWEQRRCTILHECLHAEHGPVLSTHLARHEADVRRSTARLLIPDVERIGDALAWALSLEEAAEELHVDVRVLRDRLRWLHPSERHYLHERLAD
ncbi:MAG: ImmA/IrrE family metallo-endopeptidase [Nocardioides sp.]|uniref:ImmA/IrrE family metallo-endopeptidase n=1 Tax=Nocardioides sp. TaxID=35761 RepID=UPI003F075331